MDKGSTMWFGIIVAAIILASILLFGMMMQGPEMPIEPYVADFQIHHSPCDYYTLELYNPSHDSFYTTIYIQLTETDNLEEIRAYEYDLNEKRTYLGSKEYAQLKTDCVAEDLINQSGLKTKVLIRSLNISP